MKADDRAGAEALARDMLLWLAGRPEDFGRFLAATGAGPSDIRRAAADPEMLGFVLDFLLSDEALLSDACNALAIPPDRPLRARTRLPGGDAPHWT
ncbi:MAG: DUF3572 domain-containing protein [Paracoccaceae bacterium]